MERGTRGTMETRQKSASVAYRTAVVIDVVFAAPAVLPAGRRDQAAPRRLPARAASGSADAMCRKSAIVAIVGACISAGECSPIARTMQIPPACRPKTAAFSAGQVGWQSCDAQFLTHDFGTVDKRAGQAWNCVCGCNCPHGLPRAAPTGAKPLRSTPITPASRGARRRR